MPCKLSGGIIAMANISRRGDSYRIKVFCGYDVNGKQIVQTKTWKPPEGLTDRQVKKELDRQVLLFEEYCKRGQVTATIKFQTFAEQWFDEYATINLRSTSLERQKQLTKRVYPALGHLRLDKITSRDIQKFVNDLVTKEKNMNTGKPLSRKTVVHHLSFISDVFSYAVKMGMLVDNPCRRVSVPKGKPVEKNIYTIEEITKLFGLLDGDDVPLKYRVFFKLAVYSGFRRGELLGLEWKDIEWDTNIIKVRRTSNYTKARGIYTDTTKTRKSQRCQKFPQYVMDMLKELKDEQDRERERLGDKWEDCDRLFVKWCGKPMNNQTPYGWLKEFCEKKEMRFCDIHSLRHLHCSMLINAGVDVVAVSGDLGHSCISTTLNLYSHMFQEAQARASTAIAEALRFDDKSKTDDPEKKSA